MQCFPTPPPSLALPLPPLLPSPSSLLCTVDDSDPGQSSETWGERLVPPCRIYAGNRCSPILSPRVLYKSRHPLALPRCFKHTYTHARVCVFTLHLPLLQLKHVSVLYGCSHLAGLREYCLIFGSPFQTSCLSTVSLRSQQIQGEEENSVTVKIKIALRGKTTF